MLARKGIAAQLLVLGAAYFVVLVAVAGGLSWPWRQSRLDSRARAEAEAARVDALMRLVDAVASVQDASQRLVREKDPDVVEELMAQSDKLGEQAQAAIRSAFGAEAAVESAFRAMTAANKKATDYMLLGEYALAQQTYIDESAPAFASLLDAIRTAQQAGSERARLTERQAAKRDESVQTIVLLAALLLGVGQGVASVYLSRRIAGTVRSAALELARGTDQIAAAAAQISTSAQTLSGGASRQAASLEETAASVAEINAMSRKTADRTQDINESVHETSAVVEEANRRLDELVASMRAIGHSSEKISRIIKVIDEIAFQTNILALNAAVEAARAGQAGMGFAVVADEVRNLAQRSAQAAKDTTPLIEEAIATSNDGSSRLALVTEAIRRVTTGTSDVKTWLEEMSAGSRQQAHGMEQISKAVHVLEQSGQSVAASAEESAAAGEQLSAQCDVMRGVAERLMALVDGAR